MTKKSVFHVHLSILFAFPLPLPLLTRLVGLPCCLGSSLLTLERRPEPMGNKKQTIFLKSFILQIHEMIRFIFTYRCR